MGVALLSPRHAKGHIWITDADGLSLEADTLQCAHCAKHWIVQRGSGIERGWCRNCSAPTCGKKLCDTCRPYERQMENWERPGRDMDMRKVHF